MKFESKFGVGEIVCMDTVKASGNVVSSELLKVVTVAFGTDLIPAYLCRYPRTGAQIWAAENELIGDPDFDQDAGKYPEADGND